MDSTRRGNIRWKPILRDCASAFAPGFVRVFAPGFAVYFAAAFVEVFAAVSAAVFVAVSDAEVSAIAAADFAAVNVHSFCKKKRWPLHSIRCQGYFSSLQARTGMWDK